MSDTHSHQCSCSRKFSCQIEHHVPHTLISPYRIRQLCPNRDLHRPTVLPSRLIRVDDDIFEMIRTRRAFLIRQRGAPISRNQALRSLLKDAGVTV